MRIKKGERLYKFYYFRPLALRQHQFEYRILTKEKINGKLEMVSYNFKIENGVAKKSSITRVRKISKEEMDQIVQDVKKTTNTGSDEFEETESKKAEMTTLPCIPSRRGRGNEGTKKGSCFLA